MTYDMKNQTDLIRTCDECGSAFLASASQMASLCPECAHILYGYPNCAHIFRAGKCVKCLWNGSRSAYVRALLEKSDAL